MQHEELIRQLRQYELLDPLVKAIAEDEFVMNYELDTGEACISDRQAQEFLVKELNLTDGNQLDDWRQSHGLVEDDLFWSYAHRLHKKYCVINQLLKGSGEALFLRYKDRLDRILYSLVRVESEDLAHALYFAIENNEIDFGDAAATHSAGPEAKTQGIIGPVDLTTPHPEIAARLRTASPRQLFPPFRADEWHVIIRLEYRFDSEYDEKTRRFLGSLLLGAKSKDLATEVQSSFQPALSPV